MRNKKKGQRNNKAKKKAFTGVCNGLSILVAQKAQPEGGIICHCSKAAWHEAVKQGIITMPYKITNANKALDILCVTLPLNKHRNKRVSQQRVFVCIKLKA